LKLTPRAKLLLIAAGFLAPIAASIATYVFLRPEPTANYGELLLPPAQATSHGFTRADGTPFRFAELRERWVLVASDSGACAPACEAKMLLMRQARLALGRDASRVARVIVVDDDAAPRGAAFEPSADLVVAIRPAATVLAPGAGNDRGHIYLVDPRGNVMMRWPADADFRRMLKDLQTLLKASQIG
jgi:cytochrome oxidase Cu insertion factor (SCO1/SenC/PrrC family)